MTREKEIERASVHQLNQYDYSYEEGEHLDFYIKGFTDGAKWADKHPDLSQLWHDANEEPEEETWILATNEKDIIDVYHLRKGRKYNFDGNLIDWSKFVVNFNLTKWAYIDDLLPKGGKDGFKSIL